MKARRHEASSPTGERRLRRLNRQMAHELRGPLNSISLHAALLGRAARGELTRMEDVREKQLGWIRAIEKDIERMTGDLDRWSKLLAGDGGVCEGERADD